MTANTLEILRSVYGYDSFRGLQAAIVDHVAGGRNAFVLMPTGGGKSLCYQIPALVRSGTGVVISPLIALMQDQVDALAALGVRAAFLNSTQDAETRREVEAAREAVVGRVLGVMLRWGRGLMAHCACALRLMCTVCGIWRGRVCCFCSEVEVVNYPHHRHTTRLLSFLGA